ncbi:MAG: MFS transporter, partial [Fibrobacteria bacterium]|nr:MFS transporter [Fibrobacteria bacterium]
MSLFSKDKILYFLKTKESLSEADTNKSIKLISADGICSTSMGTLQGGVFLSAFAIAIGANNYEIGLIATFTFLSQLVQIPGLLLVRAFKVRRPIVLACALISRLLWVFIMLIPVIFINAGVSFLLQWLVIAMVAGAMAGPAWNSLLRDVLPPDRMGAIMSRRMMFSTIAALLLTLAGGWFVDWWKGFSPATAMYAYSILFGLGLLFGLYGIFIISRIPEPKMDLDASQSLVDMFAGPVKDLNFRNLLVFSSIWTFA